MKIAAAILAGALALGSGRAEALDIVALTDRNELVLFDSANPAMTSMVAVQATAARLLGIDLRPADLKLYGLDAAGGIYRIDARTGMTERVSTLSVPLEIAESAVVDFNPQANRLRVIGPSGQSLRVNVETGETAVDGRIAYAEGDANAGKLPLVTAAAYLNSVAGTTQTQLFDFDSGHGFYAIQDPPNAGTLNSIAPLGLPAESRIDAADIHTDKSMMVYKSFAVVANRLFSFAVASGRMTDIGPIAAGSRKIVDIAVVSPP
ncbi:MAG: DUF4394 domain-containing protein [Rhodospirillales bacterium]|jgi:hypothetical protein